MALITLYGYAPDLLPDTPGVMTNCASFIPTQRGFAGAPSPRSLGISALAAACQGAAVLGKLDNTNRLFAGTATKLYELSSTSWTDRSRASGGNYGLASDARWSFAQYGDVTLAAAKADILQFSTTGAFANVGASVPKATIVEVVGQFAFLMDINDQGSIGSFGDSPDRWWCCAKGDYTDWTPAISSECATGTITSTAGKIRAIKRFGPHVVIYKSRSIHLGVYAGQPSIWNFDREISSQVGALSNEAVVDIGTPEEPRHIFMGFDDFYEFNGGRPEPIGQGWVKETVFSELNKIYMERSIAMADRANNLVYFFYPSGSNNNPDKCVVYNYKTERWGRADRSVEFAFEYISIGLSYDDLGTVYSTYDDLPDVSYNSTIWTAGYPIAAVFDTDHLLKTLDGASSTSGLTLGDLGDDERFSCVQRLRPRFFTAPTSATLTNFYRNNLGDSLTMGDTTNLADGKFDLMRSARWHRFDLAFVGPVELGVLDIPVVEDGSA
jgi:hypothetical protein